MLPSYQDTIIARIELNKTIDTLKKIVFDELQLAISSYYNIRFFRTLPFFS